MTNWKRADRPISADGGGGAAVTTTTTTTTPVHANDEKSPAVVAVAAVVAIADPDGLGKDADRIPNWRNPKWSTTSTTPQMSWTTAAATACR